MSSKLKGSIFVFFGACSFGILSTIVKTAYSHGYVLRDVVDSQVFIGMVTLWTLYTISLIRKNRTNENVNKAEVTIQENLPFWKNPVVWKLLASGVFTGLVGIFYYQCVKLIPASIAIILLMQNVWMSILIEFLVFKKKPSRVQVIAMCLVLGGTVLAAGLLESRVQMDPKGIVFGLLAAFSYSIFILSSGRIGNDLPVAKKSALMITGSCIATFILFPPVTMFGMWFTGGLFPWGLALALFGTIIPPFLFSKGVPMTGVSLGSILGSAELPVAVLASAVVLHEVVSIWQVLGVAIILSAIVLTNLPQKRA